MKRPVSISIDRLVLPSSMAERRAAFTSGLGAALRGGLGLPRSATSPGQAPSDRLAQRTAAEILRRAQGGADD